MTQPPDDSLPDSTVEPAAGRAVRDRNRPIKVWVTDAERADIADRAASVGMAMSNYLRTAGLNHPVRSAFDYTTVVDLVKVAGDLGRLGGLLKLWLADRRGQGSTVADVNAVLKETRELQALLRIQIGRVAKP